MPILRGMLMLDFFFLSWFGWFSMQKFSFGIGSGLV